MRQRVLLASILAGCPLPFLGCAPPSQNPAHLSPEQFDAATAAHEDGQEELDRGSVADSNLDADAQNSLFPGPPHNGSLQNRRDVLAILRKTRGDSFTAMGLHAKALVWGRPPTDPWRVGCAFSLVDVIRQRFNDTSFVILNDWNDTPDDQSMNALEAGAPNALGGSQNIDGTLMIIRAEHLLLEDLVSHGLTSAPIVSVNPVALGLARTLPCVRRRFGPGSHSAPQPHSLRCTTLNHTLEAVRCGSY